jgi:iron complex transport system substrate-binding protein
VLIARIVKSRTTRLLATVSALVAALTVLAACGSSAAPSTGAATSGNGAFPATVTHKYGTTTVPAAPQRVVSLGYTDQDAILALGVVPVAIREFTGNQPSATWPWAQSSLQGQKPQVLPVGEVSTEAIAALRPDLIVGISAGLTKEQYDTYSRLAPTISQPAAFVDYGTPWQDATKLTGAALGRSTEADRLVADLERRFTDTKAQNPVFAGKTAVGVRPSSNDNASYFAWGPEDLRSRFFSSLGLTTPPAIAQLAGNQFYATISTEQLSLLDQADVVGLITASAQERAAFQALPGYGNLKAVRDNTIVILDDEQSAALSFSSVLSLPSVLDTVPQQLAGSLDG